MPGCGNSSRTAGWNLASNERFGGSCSRTTVWGTPVSPSAWLVLPTKANAESVSLPITCTTASSLVSEMAA